MAGETSGKRPAGAWGVEDVVTPHAHLPVTQEHWETSCVPSTGRSNQRASEGKQGRLAAEGVYP